jgi:hypothetical protein
MTRCIAFLLALVVASLTVSSACLAADPLSVRFTLDSGGGGGLGRPLSVEAFGLMAVAAGHTLVDTLVA